VSIGFFRALVLCCGPDGGRYPIGRPALVGEHVCATDGRIYARVPKNLVPWCDEVKDFPKMVPELWDRARYAAEAAPWPVLPKPKIRRCERCESGGTINDASVYELADPVFGMPSLCPRCGLWTSPGEETADVAVVFDGALVGRETGRSLGMAFRANLLRLVRTFGGLLYPPLEGWGDGENLRAWYWRDVGGEIEGLVKPLGGGQVNETIRAAGKVAITPDAGGAS
jgi:hypothetical protein